MWRASPQYCQIVRYAGSLITLFTDLVSKIKYFHGRSWLLLHLDLSLDSLPVFFLHLEIIFTNRSFRCFLPLTSPFSFTFFPGILFHSAFWYPSLCYVVVLICPFRKSIRDFVSMNSGVSFHLFKFYFPIIFVHGYCFLPDFFYEVVVIFGAPCWVQSYLAVRVDDCCPVFVTVDLLRPYDLKCFYDSQLFSLIIPYPTAFPYGNGMVLHFYQQQESSTNKTVHKVINKGLKTYV